MPRTTEAMAQKDFSGGLGNALQPWDLSETQCLASDNLVPLETGGLATRPGSISTLYAQSPFPTRAIVSLLGGVYKGQEGQVAILYAPGVSNALYVFGKDAWTLIGTFDGAYPIPQMLQFRTRVIVAGGYERIKNALPDTSFGVLPAVNPPGSVVAQSLPIGACHIKTYKQRVYVYNTAATDDPNGVDGPSFLRCCEVNNPTSWPLVFSTVIGGMGDGQQGMGLMPMVTGDAALAPLSSLVLFREFGTFQLTGDLGSTFSVDQVKTNMGCVAPRSLVFLRGLGLMRLSHLGFTLFDGSADELLSETIRPYLFGDATQGISAVDWFNIQSSCAVELTNPQGYACFCPAVNGGAGNTRCFVYYPATHAWTVLQFPFAVSSVARLGFTNDPELTVTGDTSGGFVRRVFARQDADDDGAPVRWTFKPRPYTWSGRPSDDTFYRRVNVALGRSASGSSLLLTTVLEPTDRTSVITVQPIPLQPFSITGAWGNSPYGNAPYGGFMTLGSPPSPGITPTSGEWGTSPYGFEAYGGAGGVLFGTAGYGSSPYGLGPYGDGLPAAPAALLSRAQETVASFDLDQWGTALWCQLQGQGPARLRKFEMQMVPYPPTRYT